MSAGRDTQTSAALEPPNTPPGIVIGTPDFPWSEHLKAVVQAVSAVACQRLLCLHRYVKQHFSREELCQECHHRQAVP